MALDFPSSPVNGQVYDNYYWDATTLAWRSNGTPSALGPRVTAVELANATTNKSGLVPIIAPTVRVSGGSATTNAAGEVTYTAATSIQLDGIFTSAYNSYRIILVNTATSAGARITARFTTNGTPNASASYAGGTYSVTATGTSAVWSSGTGATSMEVSSASALTNTVSLSAFDVFRTSTYAGLTVLAQAQPQGLQGSIFGGFSFTGSAAFDGIVFTHASGNFTGTVKVYGYND